MILLLLARLVIVAHQPVVVHYPTMARCLAAKREIERQQDQRSREMLARGVMEASPAVYCAP